MLIPIAVKIRRASPVPLVASPMALEKNIQGPPRLLGAHAADVEGELKALHFFDAEAYSIRHLGDLVAGGGVPARTNPKSRAPAARR